jgi:GSH-dependent disulfide-bond oxidoreductase
MIDLYTWSTPNGRKVSIALEEMGLDYDVHPINIGKDEQFAPEFLAISPNNKIPGIVDRDTGLSLFESGAILIYLGEKTGRFAPTEGEEKWRMLEWLMWQMGGIGPFLGQAHHFLKFNPGKAPYAEERYHRRPSGSMACSTGAWRKSSTWPATIRSPTWRRFRGSRASNGSSIDMHEFPNVLRWYRAIAARDAVQRGCKVPMAELRIPMP